MLVLHQKARGEIQLIGEHALGRGTPGQEGGGSLKLSKGAQV